MYKERFVARFRLAPLRRPRARLLSWVLLVCFSGASRSAHAQTRAPDVSRELRLLESTERDLDPLGLDEPTGAALDRAAEQLDEARRLKAAGPPPKAVQGEVLTAHPAVREVEHAVQVRLDEGLSFVTLQLTFASNVALAAEVAYRLPLPEEAAPYELEVCRQGRCRAATPLAPEAATSREPCALCVAGDVIRDARGRALALRASPVQKGPPLSVRVRYVAPAPVHGGVVRFQLPARGYDPRAAPAQITVEAPGLSLRAPERSVQLDPNLALAVVAQLVEAGKTGQVALTRASCAGSPCTRSFEAAPRAPLSPRETWLWLDASPSMEGTARNRADGVLAALLATLPAATPLRAYAFAARAREVGRYPAEAAALSQLSRALGQDLGAASRPGAVLALAGADVARERPRILVLSDGKLDRAALRAFSTAQKRGAEPWLIALEAPSPEVARAFEGVVPVFTTQDPARIEELLSMALSSEGRAGLRHGEQRVRERLPRRPFVPRREDGWLSFWAMRARALSFDTGAPAEGALVRAPAYRAEAPSAAPESTGMPKESVLSMLRTQLIPQARACLRSDRKGRGDYAVALTFHALFADREAYETRIEGRIPEPLRECLGEVLARLRIPTFSGRIRVRYPIHTEREPEAPMVELEPDALWRVNQVISEK